MTKDETENEIQQKIAPGEKEAVAQTYVQTIKKSGHTYEYLLCTHAIQKARLISGL